MRSFGGLKDRINVALEFYKVYLENYEFGMVCFQLIKKVEDSIK